MLCGSENTRFHFQKANYTILRKIDTFLSFQILDKLFPDVVEQVCPQTHSKVKNR